MRQNRPDRLAARPTFGLGSTQTARAGSNGSGAAQVRPDWLGLGLRMIGAASILVSGAVHLQGWFEDYGSLPIIGPLFLINACAALPLAAALILARPVLTRTTRQWLIEPAVLVVGWGFGAVTLAAFLISVYVGLFGFNESFYGTPQAIAGIAEAVTIVILGWEFLRCFRRLGY